MRQVVLDTETTGLYPELGHRIIELAAVELISRRITDNSFHRYLNPDREIEQGAQQIHGISQEFLADKPRFSEIAGDFLDFIQGAELIIHNAPFDMGFLNYELGLARLEPVEAFCPSVVDTLKMAKELHPGQKNSLDALCKRYQVDNSTRTLHGALLDARLLAEVFLSMTRGQDSLVIDLSVALEGPVYVDGQRQRPKLKVIPASEEELREHQSQLEDIEKESGGGCLWKKLELVPRE
jgi:DNA polymerase-3 subunit epsilon